MVIVGATGAGKTTALLEQYHAWVRGGARTDEVLVLTAGAVQSGGWRQRVALEAHGPLEVQGFFSFVQRELTLHWGGVQRAVPQVKAWIRPTFLSASVTAQLMQGLLAPHEAIFAERLKARPERLAGQIAGSLSTLGALAGLDPAGVAARMALAGRSEASGVYSTVQQLLEVHHARCLAAGLLDYALALQLFTTVLMRQPDYGEQLGRRYRFLLVDDLDDTVPAEQEFIASVAGVMAETALAFNTDGGLRTFMGADPVGAWERFVGGEGGALVVRWGESVGASGGLVAAAGRLPAADRVTLPGSHTCTPAAFAFGDALARRVMGEEAVTAPAGLVAEHIATDLRGDMIGEVVRRVSGLIAEGVAPEEIAVLTPGAEVTLEVTARLGGFPLRVLNPVRRLVDDPYVRVIMTLGGLVNAGWRMPRETAGSFAQLAQVLLKLDPVRSAVLGQAVMQAWDLPDLAESGVTARLGLTPATAATYARLRDWVGTARHRDRPWEPDEFAQAAMAEVLAPLVRDLTPDALAPCQQLVSVASAFRTAADRLGPAAFGSRYVPLLTEAAAASVAPTAAATPGVTLATPHTYLAAGLTSRWQIWFDVSSPAWYPADVKELANPHVLSRYWEDGQSWTDAHHTRARQIAGARLARALARHCTGQIILAECSLSAWGLEQEGGLAEALASLMLRGVTA